MIKIFQVYQGTQKGNNQLMPEWDKHLIHGKVNRIDDLQKKNQELKHLIN